MHRDMPRPLDHHLHVLLPCPFGQLTQHGELGELGFIGGVGDRSRSQSIAERQCHVILTRDLEQTVIVLVQRILLAVLRHPVRHQ